MALDYATLEVLSPVIVAATALGVGGWIFNNWLRMRHGYPLENSWGKAIYPKNDGEAQARVQLLTQENAQLRAEIGSIKDRLASVERIVTDQGYDVARQIEGLREARNGIGHEVTQ
ncbi:hypothetical protein ACLIMP_00655 [Novosphingobium aerophilum]|nr:MULTISPECIES: hypothetical protein [unclassified Novosphingobium]KPH67379.1 hypothetical protein ADT71_02380 [Novosphingobium sp. ST904]MPS69473.1 hypothetical protein [Novosphingobium sp.]TCM39272.1 hypothetical protein EDF59_106153 [Novosphingobium sp. ST904]WRT92828.1 hypothetical protein U9J33_16795 [Novosphingobium sp. RL4]